MFKKLFFSSIIKNLIKFSFTVGIGEGASGQGEPGHGEPGQGEPGQGQKFEEIMDPVTKQSVKVPAGFKAVIGHFISSTRNEVEGQYKPIIQSLESDNATLQEARVELEKFREASMSAEEKAQANAKKVIAEYEKKRAVAEDEAKKYKDLFEKSTKRNDILSSFGKIALYNAGQVADLFEKEGNAWISEIVDDEGKGTNEFETMVKLQLENDKGEPILVEGRPGELFPRWINLDRNSHHIKSDVPTGSGSRKILAGNTNVLSEEFQNLPPSVRMTEARKRRQH